jgi:putative membrane protein
MIYQPNEWFTFIFHVRKQETFKKLTPLIRTVLVYTCIVVWVEVDYFHLASDSDVKQLTTIQTLLGLALSLLLVFRTNTAYDRWWEGRRQWGTLVNASRSLSIKLATWIPEENKEDRAYLSHGIQLFAQAVKQHLRSKPLAVEMDETLPFPTLDAHRHVPEQIVSLIQKRIHALEKNQVLNASQVLSMQQELQQFMEMCGACERIKNTPIPYSYNIFVKKFIFFYVMTMPFGFALVMHYWVIPIVAVVLYALASLDIIAEEIEDPFGEDMNDLPIDRICQTITKNVHEVLGPPSY